MRPDYVPVLGLALAGVFLLVVRAAADRVLSRFYPDEVLDRAPVQTVNTIIGAAAWASGALAAVLGVLVATA